MAGGSIRRSSPRDRGRRPALSRDPRRNEGSNVNFGLINTSLMLQRSIDFLWSKQTCITDNLSNAETPGYKPKYVTFEESLRTALQAADKTAAPVHGMRRALEKTPVVAHQAEETTRMDDNGVNLLDQTVELARNAYQMQYAMDALNRDFSTLRTAIRG